MSGDTVTVDREHLRIVLLAATRGMALENAIATTCALGHSSPGGLLDYTKHRGDHSAEDFVRDFIAWTSGRKRLAPGCEERLREFGGAILPSVMESMADKLGLTTEEKAS